MTLEAPANVIARIRKMLALAADSGASEGERDNAMRMAHTAMAKYNLAIAEVEASAPDAKDPAIEARVEETISFSTALWAQIVAVEIGKLTACLYVQGGRRTASGRPVKTHNFIGRAANATTAGYLAQYLVRSIEREGRARAYEESRSATWVYAFGTGAAQRIGERVRELIASREGFTESKALVLADWRNKENEANRAHLRATCPTARQVTKNFSVDADGHARGRTYAEGLSLNQQLGGR